MPEIDFEEMVWQIRPGFMCFRVCAIVNEFCERKKISFLTKTSGF
jgi:hypothetical protein